VQGLFDAALFVSGHSAEVIARAVYLPNGQLADVLFRDVTRIVDLSAIGLSVEQVTRYCLELEHFRICLADLRSSALNPRDAGLLCYRAVEALMQYYKEPEEEESKKAWGRMREDLHFDKSYLEELRRLSISNRHGVPLVIRSEIQKEILTRAVVLAGRFARRR